MCLSRQRIAAFKQGEIGRRKRAIIETINDEAKNICQMEHARKRSFADFFSNLNGEFTAYTSLPKGVCGLSFR
ncbi:transposase [Bacteroides sp. KG68]